MDEPSAQPAPLGVSELGVSDSVAALMGWQRGDEGRKAYSFFLGALNDRSTIS
jgi:hypothetical protein